MALEGYQLRAQLGAGPDGIAFQANAPDRATTVLALDLTAARADSSRWPGLVSRLRLAKGLEHPGAIQILDLGLYEKPPFAILEWPGETTLATAAATDLPGTPRETWALVRACSGALAAAHRLGIAHGRLGPDQVFLTAEGQIKLDFSGTAVGFPHARARADTLDDAPPSPREPGTLADLRSADLFNLGVLIAQIERGNAGGPEDKAHPLRATGQDEGALGKLARELMAEDPAEAPAGARGSCEAPSPPSSRWTSPETGPSPKKASTPGPWSWPRTMVGRFR